jgi:hypothetical protein
MCFELCLHIEQCDLLRLSPFIREVDAIWQCTVWESEMTLMIVTTSEAYLSGI